MTDESITKAEFFFLVALGVLVPWIIVTAIQLRLYVKKRLPAARVVASSVITLLVASVGGIVLWATVPLLTVAWQDVAEKLPNSVSGILSFFPFLPMTLSLIIVAPPITFLFLRGRSNA